jgi:hypothetical protein
MKSSEQIRILGWKKIIATALAVLIMLIALTFIPEIRYRLIRIPVRSCLGEPQQGYWGNGRQAELLLQTFAWRPSVLRRFLDDPDEHVRFVAAEETLRAGSFDWHGTSHAPIGHLVAFNGFAEGDFEQAIEILRKGFADRNTDYKPLRCWAADHIPNYNDKRLIPLLAHAMEEDGIGIHFGKMTLSDMTGNTNLQYLSDQASVGHYAAWVDLNYSNLVWNGKYFVVSNQQTKTKNEVANKPSGGDVQ